MTNTMLFAIFVIGMEEFKISKTGATLIAIMGIFEIITNFVN